jgi:hypothetical protein
MQLSIICGVEDPEATVVACFCALERLSAAFSVRAPLGPSFVTRSYGMGSRHPLPVLTSFAMDWLPRCCVKAPPLRTLASC